MVKVVLLTSDVTQTEEILFWELMCFPFSLTYDTQRHKLTQPTHNLLSYRLISTFVLRVKRLSPG